MATIHVRNLKTDGAILPTGPGSQASAAGHVGDWRSEAERAIRLALALSTRKSYAQAGRQFNAFRCQCGLRESWSIPVSHLMKFCVFLKGKGLSVRSIRSKLAALAFASKASDFTDNIHFWNMLEGWSRESGLRKNTREPLSPSLLKGLSAQWAVLGTNAFEATLFHAAALVAFFGALRVSELMACSRTDGSGWALKVTDVQLRPGSVQLVIRHSKTDQKGKGAVISLGSCQDPSLCLVLAVWQYLALRSSSGGSLFVHQDGTPPPYKIQSCSVTRRALGNMGL